MEKRAISFVMALCLLSSLISMMTVNVGAICAKSEINTAEDLMQFANTVNGGYQYTEQTVFLINDIDLSEIENWTPIGNKDYPFNGTFEGNGHTITGLTIDEPSYDAGDGGYYGLFGYVYEQGELRNLTVSGTVTAMDGDTTVGGIVGLSDGTVNYCRSYVDVCGKTAGGLVGNQDEDEIINCVAFGTVKSAYYTDETTLSSYAAGGIVGEAMAPVYNSCYFGTVESGGTAKDYLGGIAGIEYIGIANCYSAGNFIGNEQSILGTIVGGCIFSPVPDPDAKILWCYSTNNVAEPMVGECDERVNLTLTSCAPLSNDTLKSNIGSEKLNATVRVGNEEEKILLCYWGLTPYSEYVLPISATNSIVPATEFSSGDGNEERPYLIQNIADLTKLQQDVNNGTHDYQDTYFSLQVHLDLTAVPNWVPIGNEEHPFCGTFDGNLYSITNIAVNGTDNAGLFGNISSVAVVENLTLSGTVTGHTNVGLAVGQNKGTVDRITLLDSAITGNSEVGGVVGRNYNRIINCCTDEDSNVSGVTNVGGIVGRNIYMGSRIDNCYNLAAICKAGIEDPSTYTYFGGICGNNIGSIRNVYNAGTIECSSSRNARQIAGYTSNSGSGCECSYFVGDAIGGYFYGSPLPADLLYYNDESRAPLSVGLNKNLQAYFKPFPLLWKQSVGTTPKFTNEYLLPTVQSITIASVTGNDTIVYNDTLQLQVAVTPDTVLDPSVSWSITGHPENASINQKGLLTPIGVGQVTITATSNANPVVSDSMTVTITKGIQTAPSELTGVAPSYQGGSNGKITGTTSQMEYTANNETWLACSEGETTGLNALSYSVRYKATKLYEQSPSTTVVVPTSNTSAPSHTSHHSSSTLAPIIIGGKTVSIGQTKTTATETTVTVDQKKLAAQIATVEERATVTIPVSDKKGTASAELVVKNVDDMAKKETTLSVTSGDVAYHLPTKAVNTTAVMDELGATHPEDVPFKVTITEVTGNSAEMVEQALQAHTDTLILPPVTFSVTASYNGKTNEIESFKNYVARTIKVPQTMDASKITTAIVVEPDGSIRHVPTEVFKGTDGMYYANIHSLTNSTYALIHREAHFDDAVDTWYEDIATEMASREIVNGKQETVFDGDAKITRAEFVSIVVRALGLPSDGTCNYVDVPAGAWYAGSVGTAVEYGIANGRTSKIFDPMATITRQEAMVMLQNAAQIAEFTGNGSTECHFSDTDDIGEWAKTAVTFNTANGLILGTNGKIRPKDPISRAESATIILRLLQKANLVDVRITA